MENFIQATFNAVEGVKGGLFIISGDGRYFNDKAILKTLRIAAANGVSHVVVGQKFLLSTPAVSHLIRKRKASGGIIFTASHNAGGPDGDFGVKFNTPNGAPAPESVTAAIFSESKTLSSYQTIDEKEEFIPSIGGAEQLGTFKIGNMTVEVVDATAEYVELMSSLFDFESLRSLFSRPNFRFIFDAMSGVGGIYGKAVFVDALGASPDCLLRCEPSENFGGGHPDPNLVYAKSGVVTEMGLGDTQPENIPDFGAACDGDADRNMVLGRRFFVTPPDSLAIIAANSCSIPYFKNNPMKGVARSMPTSTAADRVAAARGMEAFEVPTGWKFFCNLMDAGRISLCGEESFGTGSDHVREKVRNFIFLIYPFLHPFTRFYLALLTVCIFLYHNLMVYKEGGKWWWRGWGEGVGRNLTSLRAALW